MSSIYAEIKKIKKRMTFSNFGTIMIVRLRAKLSAMLSVCPAHWLIVFKTSDSFIPLVFFGTIALF